MNATLFLRKVLVWVMIAVGMLLAVAPAAGSAAAATEDPQWRAEYYNNRTLTGAPALVRNDAKVAFDWAYGAADSRLPADNFSVRWTRQVYFLDGRYRFTTLTDDGVRLYVDGKLVIDHWSDMARTKLGAEVELSRGVHTVRMEYYEHNGGAIASLWWEKIDPAKGNIVTCVRPSNSWIKVYRLEGDTWTDVNPHGWGALSRSGYLKLDGMLVNAGYYGAAGHPYRVELWANGGLVTAVGDTAHGQPAFRVRAGADNPTPWACPAP